MLKPFVKWLGGKTQLLDKITPQIPEDTEVYIELFLGGGAVLLNQLETNNNIKLFIANDLNLNLIDAYNCIKFNNSFFLLKDEIEHIAEQFNATDKKKEIERNGDKVVSVVLSRALNGEIEYDIAKEDQ